MKRGENLKDLDNTKQWNIVSKSNVGFIEDVYGTGVSFNVFSRLGTTGIAKFYKSAYKLTTAKRYLTELTQ